MLGGADDGHAAPPVTDRQGKDGRADHIVGDVRRTQRLGPALMGWSGTASDNFADGRMLHGVDAVRRRGSDRDPRDDVVFTSCRRWLVVAVGVCEAGH